MLSEKAKIQGTPQNVKARLDIAYDVLKLMAAEKILPKRRRSYVVATSAVLDLIRKNPFWELKKVFISAKEACEVCALGAMFVADIRRNSDYTCDKTVERAPIYSNNDLESKEITPDRGANRRLRSIFNSSELEDIEAAFEAFSGTDHRHPTYLTENANANQKLTFLMHNIIWNNGYFSNYNWPPADYIPHVRIAKKKPKSNCLKVTT